MKCHTKYFDQRHFCQLYTISHTKNGDSRARTNFLYEESYKTIHFSDFPSFLCDQSYKISTSYPHHRSNGSVVRDFTYHRALSIRTELCSLIRSYSYGYTLI